MDDTLSKREHLAGLIASGIYSHPDSIRQMWEDYTDDPKQELFDNVSDYALSQADSIIKSSEEISSAVTLALHMQAVSLASRHMGKEYEQKGYTDVSGTLNEIARQLEYEIEKNDLHYPYQLVHCFDGQEDETKSIRTPVAFFKEWSEADKAAYLMTMNLENEYYKVVNYAD